MNVMGMEYENVANFPELGDKGAFLDLLSVNLNTQGIFLLHNRAYDLNLNIFFRVASNMVRLSSALFFLFLNYLQTILRHTTIQPTHPKCNLIAKR